MKTIIIEDENLTAKRLESLLHKYDPVIHVEAILPSVKEAVHWFDHHAEPDLIFMDIHLEDDLAFKIFEHVRILAPVIFTTAYDEYMIQAFKVNSIDYLLKPINYDELVQAIDKFKTLKNQFAQPNLETLLKSLGQKKPEYKSRFMITVGTRIKSIETTEIAYFYSEEKLTFMVTKEGQNLPIDFSLDKLTSLLNPRDFFRISRQFLVSFQSIQTVHAHIKGKLKLELMPKTKLEVLVSGDRMTDFKEWLGR
ncbi:MAG: response regulator transcription factor [Saprospiraceae bacterium]|nr:response regulator transcription factor [Candidatus Opimibacter iunctus]